MSLGQKMRCELAMAFLHDPEIVFLDEPTIGLDVVAKDRIRKSLKRINAEKGTTIILTTHDLGDIEYVCERLLMIDTGKIIWDGTITDIKKRFGNTCRLEIELIEEPPEGFCSVSGRVVEDVGLKKATKFNRGEVSASTVISELMKTCRIKDLSLQETRVEDIVREIYESKALQA